MRRKTAEGSLSMMAALLTVRGANMVAWIFLARLLEPEDFGAVTLAMLVFSTAALVSGLGLDPAVVQSKLCDSRIAFPAFLITSASGLILFLLVIGNASNLARFLGDAEIASIVRALSATVLFDSLAIVPSAMLRKQLSFGRVSQITIVTELVNTACSLGGAFAGFGLWSLVAGRIASSASRLILFWTWGARPVWAKPVPIRLEDCRGLLRYGIKNAGSGWLSFLNSNWDDWLVGRVLGTAQLGFYSKAYNFSNKTITGFNRQVINIVLFPSFAKIQDQKERLERVYVKSLSLIALLMCPVSLGVLITAREIVPLLLGEKWLPMVTTLQVFALMALMRSLSGSTSPLFKAVGQPELDLRVGLVLGLVMVPLVLGLLGNGIAGVAIGVTAAHAVGFAFNVFQANRLLPGVAKSMIGAIMPALWASGAMIGIVQAAKSPLLALVGGQHNLFSVAVMIFAGALAYMSTGFLLRRALIIDVIGAFMDVLPRRAKPMVKKKEAHGKQGV